MTTNPAGASGRSAQPASPRVLATSARARGLVDRCCELQASLGYPVRMKMIKVLGSHRDDPVSVSEVAEMLRISQPTATKHLSILHRAGWVTRVEVGPRVHYCLNLDTYTEYRRLMDLAFTHALTPCVNSFDCHTCPFEETCR